MSADRAMALRAAIAPPLTLDTPTWWDESGGWTMTLLRDLMGPDRKVVAWDAETHRYVGEYPY